MAFAVAPVVGQNFGGRRNDRVRSSYYSALGISSVTMLVLTIASQFAGESFIRLFSTDTGVIAFGTEYLRIIYRIRGCWNCLHVFQPCQGIGNTLPPLVSSMTRLILFVLPAILVFAHAWVSNQTCLVFVGRQHFLAGLRQSFAPPSRVSKEADIRQAGRVHW